MKKIPLLYLLVVIGLFSCKHRNVHQALFDEAEKLMDVCPDSSLILLSRLEHPEKLQGAESAAYALLLTQARDKNYQDSLQSDSLIGIAVDYYKNVSDKVKAGKALFYSGKMRALNHRCSDAMNIYLEAERSLDGTNAYKLQGMLQEYMGYLSFDQGLYADATNHYHKAIVYYDRLDGNNSTLVVDCCRNLAHVFLALSKGDSAQYYVDKGLVLLSDTANYVRSSLFQLQGLLVGQRKEHVRAVGYFLTAIKLGKERPDHYRYYLSLGNSYENLGEIEKAKNSYLGALRSKNPYLQAGAYHYLYRLEKNRKSYEEAISYKEKSDSLLDIVHNEKLQSELLTLQRKFENEKLKSDNIRIMLRERNHIYLFSLVCMLVILLSVLGLRFVRKKYRRHFLRNIELIRKNERDLREYAYQISRSEQTKALESKKSKENLEQLNRKVSSLTAENQELRENVCVDAIFVLDQLKQGKLIIERMTPDERQHLFDYTDLVFASFISRLTADIQLTKSDLMLAALLKFGFSNNQLMMVFDCEMNSVYKMKQRLKAHLGLSKDESLERFISFF